ncbi:MAG: peptidoglycan-binding protein [Candidatus Thiodiazotropha lotti]|nr:peptidoglycan-binding protein [Candidatus Thiodiazotropha lotti]
MAINFDKVPSYIRREIDPPSKTVKRGSRGQAVKRIQEWLNFHDCRTSIDADFGPATEACVKDFQRMKRKPPSGKVDKAIWNLLLKPMTAALRAPANLRGMTPQQAIITVANQHVNEHPIEIGGANCGPWVRLYCYGHDGSQWAWCAGFVTFIMQQAYFYFGQRPPIKGSVSCDTLKAQAQAAGLFVSEREITSGQRVWAEFGDACMFLHRRTPTDWTHTGIAFGGTGRPAELVFSTIEGNTNDEGVREGIEACRRKRGVAGTHYDFIAFT